MLGGYGCSKWEREALKRETNGHGDCLMMTNAVMAVMKRQNE